MRRTAVSAAVLAAVAGGLVAGAGTASAEYLWITEGYFSTDAECQSVRAVRKADPEVLSVKPGLSQPCASQSGHWWFNYLIWV